MSSEKSFVGVCGNEDFGKSVELKTLIYTLAQDEKTKKCLVKLVKLSTEAPDYYDNFKNKENIEELTEFKNFLKNASSNEVDLKESKNLALFEKCIKREFKNKKGKYFELDFVAKIFYRSETDTKIITICTIGDKICFIKDNIDSDIIKNSDLIITSLRNNGQTKKAFENYCFKYNLLSLKIIVSKSKKIVLKTSQTKDGKTTKTESRKEKSIKIGVSVDGFSEEFYKILKKGFDKLVDWLKKIN